MDNPQSIQVFVVLFAIAFASGFGLYFVAWLMGVLSAAGQKRYLWSAGQLLLNPLVLVYSSLHRHEARYPFVLAWWGVALILLALVAGLALFGDSFFPAVIDSFRHGPSHGSPRV